MTTPPSPRPLGEAPRDVAAIAAQESAHALPYWNSELSFRLGTLLRARLLTFPKPAVVHISTLSTPPHVLFHSVTHDGTALDNDYWVARKRAAVIRFGASTWRLQIANGGDEEAFARKFALGGSAGEYAIHGGGVPVFVRGVEGPVAVCVVSGLKQWDDHMVVVEALGELCEILEREGRVV